MLCPNVCTTDTYLGAVQARVVDIGCSGGRRAVETGLTLVAGGFRRRHGARRAADAVGVDSRAPKASIVDGVAVGVVRDLVVAKLTGIGALKLEAVYGGGLASAVVQTPQEQRRRAAVTG